MNDLGRSASTYRAEGIYTHMDHTAIMTTMSRQQGSRLQRVIREADPHAFVVITNTSQVIGKGFPGRKLIVFSLYGLEIRSAI